MKTISINDLKNNGSVAIRDYIDSKTKEVENRINIRATDYKNLMRRMEREFRIVQSRIEKFNNHLERNNIKLGE